MFGMLARTNSQETILENLNDEPSASAEISQLKTKITDALKNLIDHNYETGNIDDPELSLLFQKLRDSLRAEALQELQSTVSYSMNASHAMASVSQVTGSTREADHKIQVMAAATEQMTASISQISDISSKAATNAQEVKNGSQQGMQQIEISMSQMNEIADSVVAISGRTNELISASEQISGILETIDAIADQTNLLALNATIEAARAGEHGKGFSVVAGEVKALANQTASATEDIRGRISQLENEIEALNNATARSTQATHSGREAMSEVSEQIQSIGQQVNDVSDQMSTISHMLTEQSTAVAEISEGVMQVADISKQNKENADSTIEAVKHTEALVDQRFSELEKKSIKDAVLYRAKSDHFLWKKRLAEMLVGLNSLDPNELADHHSCRLGKWYDSIDDEQLLNNETFKAIVEPHRIVHECGIQAAKLFKQGKQQEAWEAYKLMDDASKDVIQLLDRLISQQKN